ncbi:pleiotropic drug resistance protein 2-like [Primulina huaijiensis]|uniref:pleiotropic drug resistance protein 2-like n=1 Tax=Primulina huaijiensis TaxID=1492673 RepID=UPI003CC758F3
MLVRLAKAFFMDEISTGLPAPETYELFDDVILLSDGQIVYEGAREDVHHFFVYMGFKCPERKGIVYFLQEVTSKNDQNQNTESRTWSFFRACFAREWLLMKRSSFVYIFKTTQITIMATIALTVFLRMEMKAGTMADSSKFLGALFFSLINAMFNVMKELAMTVFRLHVFFKQRDSLFYPAWAFSLPIGVLRVPISVMESGLWIVLTYYSIGFAPSPARFFKQFQAFIGVHQMALSLFRFIAAAGRTQVIANTLGSFTLLLVFVQGGFVVAKDGIQDWMIWGYYISPMMYGQNAIAIDEFLSERWNT